MSANSVSGPVPGGTERENPLINAAEDFKTATTSARAVVGWTLANRLRATNGDYGESRIQGRVVYGPACQCHGDRLCFETPTSIDLSLPVRTVEGESSACNPTRMVPSNSRGSASKGQRPGAEERYLSEEDRHEASAAGPGRLQRTVVIKQILADNVILNHVVHEHAVYTNPLPGVRTRWGVGINDQPRIALLEIVH